MFLYELYIKNMKILMMPSWYSEINDSTKGIFTKEFSLALEKEIDTRIYYINDTSLDCKFSNKLEDGLKTYRINAKDINKIFKILGFRRKVKIIKVILGFLKIKREFNPDIIHAHVASEAGYYAVIISKIFKIPVIITEHSPFGNKNKKSKFTFENSNYNICVSNFLKEDLEKIYPNIKFNVIYNGILEKKQKELIKKKQGVVNIVFVGSFYHKEIKGLQYLLPAIKIIKEKGYSLKLNIIGDGIWREYYNNNAKSLNLTNECLFLGNKTKEEVFEIMRKSDFLISSSIIETFGCAIAEAMMVGLPVVITESGGPQDFVNEKIGIVVKKKSVDDLAKGIENMLLNIDDYDNRYIAEVAREKFGMRNIVIQHKKIYNLFRF